MRLALLTTAIAFTCACSNSSNRREDSATPMPPSPQKQADAGPYVGPKVFVSSPKGDVEVKVEVVATEAKIQKGLMFRQHLPTDAGMLFLMGEEKEWPFWMRNTLIPLDMLFIGADGRIATIHSRAVPLDETPISSKVPVVAVLELNGGTAERLGIKPGDKVVYPASGG